MHAPTPTPTHSGTNGPQHIRPIEEKPLTQQ
jgi:hypothetical protein